MPHPKVFLGDGQPVSWILKAHRHSKRYHHRTLRDLRILGEGAPKHCVRSPEYTTGDRFYDLMENLHFEYLLSVGSGCQQLFGPLDFDFMAETLFSVARFKTISSLPLLPIVWTF